MKKGSKLTEEQKRKVSEATKRAMANPEIRAKISKAHKGKAGWNKGKKGLQVAWNKGKHTDLIPWNKGLKGIHLSQKSEFKKGQQSWNKGLKGIMKPNLTSFKKGQHVSQKTEFKKGHKLSEEKMRKKIEAQTGEKSHLWKGGISFEPYSTDWTRQLKKIIRKRDYNTCQICGKWVVDKKSCIHHIDYNKKNCNPENLIGLCRSCHSKTNSNREKWKQFFKEHEFKFWEIEVPIINGNDKEALELLKKLNEQKKAEFEKRNKP